MISALSPLLLGYYDAAESISRLYRHDPSADLAAAAPNFGNLLSTTNQANSADTSSLQSLFEELFGTSTSPFGTTYSETGAATRSSANTILLGYG
jgi:hypothetical protein